MNSLVNQLETERCFLKEAKIDDLEIISSILSDNFDAICSQGYQETTSLAKSLINHTDLPPQGNPSQEKTCLVFLQGKTTVIGVLSFYQGYPTTKTLYVGSLFLFQDFHRQGFGTELIQKLEKQAATVGYEEARVVVGLKNWQGLIFWVKLGFNQITKITGNEKYAENAYADLELVKRIHC